MAESLAASSSSRAYTSSSTWEMGGEPLGGPALADGVDPLLRRLQHVLAGLGALLNENGELSRRLRHPAQQGLVL